MSTVAVRVIPPVQSADPPAFDRCAFDKQRPRAISAETGISFSDFQWMHIHYREGGGRGHRTSRFIPKFAESDEQLQKVIAFSALLYGKPGSLGTMAKRARTVDQYTMEQLEQMTAAHFNDLRSWQLEAGSMQSRMIGPSTVSWLPRPVRTTYCSPTGYDCQVEAAVQETITAVEVPDAVGLAFLRSGLPQTVGAFVAWLKTA